MPRVDWEPRAMRYSMCFFPLIGLVIGLIIWGWLALAAWLDLGVLLRATGVLLVSLAVTGGIHMDGFADVVDAQSSHAEPERKRQILKDPHTGAFAIIGVAAYLLAYVALASELVAAPAGAGGAAAGAAAPGLPIPASWLLLCCLPWMSRCVAGLASVAFPRSSKGGMLAAFGGSADKKVTFAVLLAAWALGAAVMLAADHLVGGLVCASDLVVLAWLHRFARKEFGGMSGDLAGFLLQLSELVMLAVLVFATKVVML